MSFRLNPNSYISQPDFKIKSNIPQYDDSKDDIFAYLKNYLADDLIQQQIDQEEEEKLSKMNPVSDDMNMNYLIHKK